MPMLCLGYKVAARVRQVRLTLVVALGLALSACAASPPTVASKNYDYDAIIRATQAAFRDRNPDAAIEVFEDDGAFYRVTDQGAVELVRGKENLRRAIKMTFGAENKYTGSKAVRLGLIQNVLIMYHEDSYQTEDGIKTVPRVVVVEHRNGKRWREWQFSPQDQ